MQNIPAHVRDEILESLKSRCETPVVLVGTYCPELAVFYKLMGKTVRPDSIYRSESGLSNPFGGANFPAERTIKIDHLDDSIAIISMSKAIPEPVRNTIAKELRKKINLSPQKVPDENYIPKFDMTVSFIYSFNYQKNLIEKIDMEKNFELEDIYWKDTLSLTLKN